MLFPSFLLGNAGVPFFTSSIGYSVLLLIPIILIEAYVVWKGLKLRWWRSLLLSTYANIVSTLVGTLLFLFIGVLLSSALMFGFVNPITISLFVLEFLVTLIPMFYVSVWLEWRIWQARLKKVDRAQVKKIVFTAHLYSYGLLASHALGKLLIALVPSLLRRDPNWWLLYLK